MNVEQEGGSIKLGPEVGQGKGNKVESVAIFDPHDAEEDHEALQSSLCVQQIRQLPGKHPLAYSHNRKHLLVEEFLNGSQLRGEWKLPATAMLPKANFKQIVEAVEHTRFPFSEIQFHPEKALFQNSAQQRTPHSFLLVLPSWYIATAVGLFARCSQSASRDEREK
ncbi:gamma-glutamyl hydrolase, putative [Eimeria praecox]|uniref:Gamma-glutamyl hydrolase, putative n=1 Tax=Eimeria praecox TaxID=51316 RepID=U6H1R3_9EIME|nr:gamma-glutamyl hydrolase, putative [Eimeria praecox]